MTYQEIITKLKTDNNDDPKTLSDYLVQLSANLWSDAEMDAEINYVGKWNEIRNEEKMTDKQAEMKSKLTPEWKLWQQIKNENKTLIEVIRAIKNKLRNLEVAYREHQNY